MKKILEIGSGVGLHFERMTGSNITHLDINPKAYHVEIVADVTDMHMIADKSYDIVIMKHVLEHVPNPVKALTEVKRVCSGTAFIVVPNAGYFKGEVECLEHLFSWTQFTFYQLLAFVYGNAEVWSRLKFKQTEYLQKCGVVKRFYHRFLLRLCTTLSLTGNELVGVVFCSEGADQ